MIKLYEVMDTNLVKDTKITLITHNNNWSTPNDSRYSPYLLKNSVIF